MNQKFRPDTAARDIKEALERLIEESEELLQSAGAQDVPGIDAIRDRLRHRLDTVRGNLGEWRSVARQRYRRISSSADDYVHDNAWATIGIAAAVGVLIGYLLRGDR